ncbi:hypothetical protein QEH52_10215 [Coraliomargarita sp. SDUM461003]|uniref:DUF4384 domain-containing protein n=1 Tax=Thalassobacterium maritimum TaxID=3041265 RepID=A0ABU1AUP4_9BACT|nr:hypothetical protein [Coraliomargarita sp. SDUM461003]MDQ8207886.1 hypothetical protein [Coraliomargarita sp. SDUM461003]
MKTILCFFLFSVGLSALGAAGDISQATVTLPYSELRGLLERAQAASDDRVPPKPPVDVWVQSANYVVDCTDLAAVSLQARFSVVNLSDTWQAVFLVKDSEGIRSLDPPDAKLVPMDGGRCLLLEPKAASTVTLGLQAAPVQRSQRGQLLADFMTVGAGQSTLELRHAEDPAAIIVTGAVAANREKTKFSLPASGGSVKVKLYAPEAMQPTQWQASAKHWIRDLGGVMQVSCHLRLNATDGGLTSRAQVRLASPASVNSVADFGRGGGVRDSIEMTAQGPILHLEWPHDEATTREVMIQYAVPIDLVAEQFAVPLVRVEGAKKTDSACYLSDFDGVEVTPAAGAWMPLGRLPDWMGASVRIEKLRYLTLSDTAALELSARPLPRVKTASATVETAEYVSELVPEGSLLHRAKLVIEHADAAEYRFVLPAGGKLLSSSINGRSMDPLLAEDGGLILNLPKGSGTHSKTTVGYVFTSKGPKMNPVEGRVSLELPRTPLFVHRLIWQLQLPSEYQATALEGNVVIDAGDAQGGSVRLSKQIYDDEAPVASLYYTRRDLER